MNNDLFYSYNGRHNGSCLNVLHFLFPAFYVCAYVCGRSGDDLRFYLRFHSISFTSGRLVGDNEGCVQWPPFTIEKLSASPAGLEPGTARSVDQRLTY